MNYGVILVEGRTELRFVNDLLNPDLAMYGLMLKPVSLDGNPKYVIWKKTVQYHLHRKDTSLVTTMLDFYRLPLDFPGRQKEPAGSITQQVHAIEQAWEQDIDVRTFRAYIACQEFEALLFADTAEIARVFPDKAIADRLKKIRRGFPNPEEIDDKTSPSMHILSSVGEEYQKPLHGPTIAQAIGLPRIRAECPHFNDWVTQLEGLGTTQ